MKRILGAAALAVTFALAGCGGSAPKQELNLFIWTEYLPDEVIQQFTARTGIKVNYDTYDSNDTVLEKLQSGVAGYDLVCPSDYMVEILIREGLVQKMDKASVPNLANIGPKFMNQAFDPENGYSAPYTWGTTGIGYNKQKVAAPVDSWAAMFDPQYKNRILMLNDMREAFGAALRLMGSSINETDPIKLQKAAEMLQQQKALVQTYNSSDFANLLNAGDVDLAQGYNGEIAKVVAAAPDRLAYVVPREGATLWMDSLCIPAKAKNVAAAHAFINYVLEPEVMAKVVNSIHYATPNVAAKPYIAPEILNDPAIYPPDDVIEKCEFLADTGEAMTLMDKLWTEIKAQ